MDAMYKVKNGNHHHWLACQQWNQLQLDSLWQSLFTASQVIVNRTTPAHRDSGSAPPMYDLLTSAGTHSSAQLALPDLEATLSYSPGTVIAIAAKVLLHGVNSWTGGERICIAHYMRDAVLGHLGVERPHWVVRGEEYNYMMCVAFRRRHGLMI